MVARAIKDEVEKEIGNLGRNTNNIFEFAKSMQKDSKNNTSTQWFQ